jgi:hypothetical protein
MFLERYEKVWFTMYIDICLQMNNIFISSLVQPGKKYEA